MSKKYTYSREVKTTKGVERFTAVEFDSFDEAIKAVDKGIYDREISLAALIKTSIPAMQSQGKITTVPAINTPTWPGPNTTQTSQGTDPQH